MADFNCTNNVNWFSARESELYSKIKSAKRFTMALDVRLGNGHVLWYKQTMASSYS